MLVLYHCNNSYASQKVRLFLAEKKICWREHHIDLLKQEHITPEYQRINPRGLVPALDDEGRVILNSTDIMEYIIERYVPKTSTLSVELLGQIHSFCKEDELLHDPHIRILSYHYLWMGKPATSEEVSRVLLIAKSHPDKTRGMFLAKAIQRQITGDEVFQANQAILSALEYMEHQLKKQHHSEFFFGNEYTMADAVATARLFRLYRLNLGDTIEKYPLIIAYYARMRQRPNFIEANLI